MSCFFSRNDVNLRWEQGLLLIFTILCAALMEEAGRLQKWSNFTAVSLSLASSCCSHSNGFLQLSNVRSTEIMLYLGRNEKALHGRGRYRQTTHQKKIVCEVKQSLLIQAVFSLGVPCSVWKGKVEGQLVRQEGLKFKMKLSLLLWSQIWRMLEVVVMAPEWKNLTVPQTWWSSVPAQHWSTPGRAPDQVGSLHSVQVGLHWFRSSLTLYWIDSVFLEVIIKENILEKSPCRAWTQV